MISRDSHSFRTSAWLAYAPDRAFESWGIPAGPGGGGDEHNGTPGAGGRRLPLRRFRVPFTLASPHPPISSAVARKAGSQPAVSHRIATGRIARDPIGARGPREGGFPLFLTSVQPRLASPPMTSEGLQKEGSRPRDA